MTINGKKSRVATGKDFGAIRVSDLKILYEPQRIAVVDIVTGVHKVASATYVERRGVVWHTGDTAATLQKRREYERPHHSYVVDGVRGSGKTTALLTIRNLLENLCLDSNTRQAGVADRELLDSLRSLELRPPDGADGRERLALVLPVVFTEDMESRESAMDAIFALIQHKLDGVLKESGGSDQHGKIKSLKKELRDEVTFPWAYARGIGAEAMVQDTIDYQDYVGRRADYNVRCYTRIELWHNFVERLLDSLGLQVLVVLFDDSDLDQRAAEDIIRSMRIYLSHPRIVSVLAVDMTTLFIALNAHHLSQNVGVIGLDKIGLSDEVIKLTESNHRALFDKVLPVALRRRLNVDDLNYMNQFFDIKDEISQVADSFGDNIIKNLPDSIDTDYFGYWCYQRFSTSGTRGREADLPRNLLSAVWWLLDGPYRRMVADNLRHVVLFREETRDLDASPLPPLTEYFRLRRLMGQVDDSLETLRSFVEVGTLAASWPVGAESPDAGLDEYEESFIDMWVDANIVYRKLRVWNSAIVRGWLPDPIGDGREPAIQDPDKRFGIAGIEATRLPRNCLFIHQYRLFSNLVLRGLPEGSQWLRYLKASQAAELQQAAGDFIVTWENEPDDGILGAIGSELDQARSAARHGDWSATSLVTLIAASRPGSNDKASFFNHLKQIRDGKGKAATTTFIERLTDAVGRAEQRRQEALFTWACALEIADMGDDNWKKRTFGPRKQLAVTFGASSRDFEPRFLILVNKTIERLDSGGRHALLLQWSLAPLLACLHQYGTDYRRGPEGPSPAWKEIAAMQVASIPSESISDPQTRWMFADMNQETLSKILNDVRVLISSFETELAPQTAPGSISLEGGWPETPARFLAAILITSEQWVTEEKLVA